MRANRRRDTGPEMALRRELHRRGLRFRVDHAPLPGIPRRADIVFTRARVAVFVDGCFWHACPDHGNLPRTNRDWWRTKLELNVARDRRTDEAFRERGWRVIRIWEHETLDAAVDRVVAAIGQLRVPAERHVERDATASRDLRTIARSRRPGRRTRPAN
jgi:DNA mismatch endonuclease (patch repair protein)